MIAFSQFSYTAKRKEWKLIELSANNHCTMSLRHQRLNLGTPKRSKRTNTAHISLLKTVNRAMHSQYKTFEKRIQTIINRDKRIYVFSARFASCIPLMKRIVFIFFCFLFFVCLSYLLVFVYLTKKKAKMKKKII